jgi:hypothetical protein
VIFPVLRPVHPYHAIAVSTVSILVVRTIGTVASVQGDRWYSRSLNHQVGVVDCGIRLGWILITDGLLGLSVVQ